MRRITCCSKRKVRELFLVTKVDSEALVMYGKSSEETMMCSACGKTGHSKEKYWSVVGYPT